MPLAIPPINAFRRIAPYIVGATVHGSSLFFMIHGFVRNAWYGYAFALIYAVAFLAFFIMIRRARRRADVEFQKMLGEQNGSGQSGGA